MSIQVIVFDQFIIEELCFCLAPNVHLLDFDNNILCSHRIGGY